MFGIGTREVFGLAVVFGIAGIPVVTATILSWRSFRRRGWLVAPGSLYVALVGAFEAVFHVTGQIEEGSGGAMLGMALWLGGWAASGLVLTALAIAGPKLPKFNVSEVF